MTMHVWTALCKQAIIDRSSNQLSLIDTIDQLAFLEVLPDEVAKENAGVAVEMALVTLWARGDFNVAAKGETRDVIHYPDGKKRIGTPRPIDLETGHRARHVRRINALSFHGFGRYMFVVEIKVDSKGKERWKQVAKVPLDVTQEISENTASTSK